VGSVKMWLWEEKGLPLKMEMTAPSGEKTTIEYSNIDLSNIPDSMFEIPAGTTIIET
jgi:outer membrane lipoprotein-sorting protein